MLPRPRPPLAPRGARCLFRYGNVPCGPTHPRAGERPSGTQLVRPVPTPDSPPPAGSLGHSGGQTGFKAGATPRPEVHPPQRPVQLCICAPGMLASRFIQPRAPPPAQTHAGDRLLPPAGPSRPLLKRGGVGRRGGESQVICFKIKAT